MGSERGAEWGGGKCRELGRGSNLGLVFRRRKDYFPLWMCHFWEPALLSFALEGPVFRLSSVLLGRLHTHMRSRGYAKTQGTLKKRVLITEYLEVSVGLNVISKRSIFKRSFQTQYSWKLSVPPRSVATVLSGILLKVSLPALKFAEERFSSPAS